MHTSFAVLTSAFQRTPSPANRGSGISLVSRGIESYFLSDTSVDSGVGLGLRCFCRRFRSVSPYRIFWRCQAVVVFFRRASRGSWALHNSADHLVYSVSVVTQLSDPIHGYKRFDAYVFFQYQAWLLNNIKVIHWERWGSDPISTVYHWRPSHPLSSWRPNPLHSGKATHV